MSRDIGVILKSEHVRVRQTVIYYSCLQSNTNVFTFVFDEQVNLQTMLSTRFVYVCENCIKVRDYMKTSDRDE